MADLRSGTSFGPYSDGIGFTVVRGVTSCRPSSQVKYREWPELNVMFDPSI